MAIKQSRSREGSILAIGALVLLILSLVIVFCGQTIWSFLLHDRYKQALEAASLKAASDLSEIVINDPYFGFVSLSDRPAAGHATRAEDGQPVPILGINTIIAASRLNYLIATELGDSRLEEFARQDGQHAQEAAMKLDKILEQSLRQDCKDALDMDGNMVRPYADAINTYNESIKFFTKDPPLNFNLKLGWLKESGATVTPVPYAAKSHYSKPEHEIKGCYRAYVDIPVGNQHFSFASLGSQPSLVDSRQFMPADGKHISTIVKAQASCQLHDLMPWKGESRQLDVQACAQPFSLDRKPASSVLVLTFPDGLPPGIDTMRDLLTSNSLNECMMRGYSPLEDDFPSDRNAPLHPLGMRGTATSSFALILHDWLRSNYAVPHVEPVLAAVNQSLSHLARSAKPSFAVVIGADGNVVISQLSRGAFPEVVVQEKQLYLTTDTPVMIGTRNWNFQCRDQVHTLGTLSGGKHAGQPLASDPINWDELGTFVNPSFTRASVSRRPPGIRASGLMGPSGGIALADAQLTGPNGQTLSRDFRTSSYSSGLAAEVILLTARPPLR